MSSLKYWVWLSRCFGKSDILLRRFGNAENVYAADAEAYRDIEGMTAHDVKILSDKRTAEAEKIIEACNKKEIRILTMQDSAYPDRLKHIAMAPPVLYTRGRPLDIDDEIAVAIVGTRRCTSYGIRAAGKISKEIAERGGLLVSGMARGVDTAAMTAAVNVGGSTVAVLGSGTDVCYPPENRKLMDAIMHSGMVVSEFAPGTPPLRENFPRRNRLISGMSLGTVIVEAPMRSGALITAARALEQGRDVFAVMGDIFSRESAGSNKLICDGATPVMCGADVISEYAAMLPHRIKHASRAEPPEPTLPVIGHREEEQKRSLPREYLERFDAEEQKLLSAMCVSSVDVDILVAESGFSPQKVMTMLTLLEINGAIEQESGGRFRLSETAQI